MGTGGSTPILDLCQGLMSTRGGTSDSGLFRREKVKGPVVVSFDSQQPSHVKAQWQKASCTQTGLLEQRLEG